MCRNKWRSFPAVDKTIWIYTVYFVFFVDPFCVSCSIVSDKSGTEKLITVSPFRFPWDLLWVSLVSDSVHIKTISSYIILHPYPHLYPQVLFLYQFLGYGMLGDPMLYTIHHSVSQCIEIIFLDHLRSICIQMYTKLYKLVQPKPG